jgi:hypothetical protein
LLSSEVLGSRWWRSESGGEALDLRPRRSASPSGEGEGDGDDRGLLWFPRRGEALRCLLRQGGEAAGDVEAAMGDGVCVFWLLGYLEPMSI